MFDTTKDGDAKALAAFMHLRSLPRPGFHVGNARLMTASRRRIHANHGGDR